LVGDESDDGKKTRSRQFNQNQITDNHLDAIQLDKRQRGIPGRANPDDRPGHGTTGLPNSSASSASRGLTF
jgi:hypothetical protein